MVLQSLWPDFPVWRRYTVMVAAIAWAFAAGACSYQSVPERPLPENLGYLRSAEWTEPGRLVVFDADTFEIYRTVEIPQSQEYVANRMELDDRGRIWLSYTQDGLGRLPWFIKTEVLVFSPGGELLHSLEPQCGPVMDIAIAEGRAFLLCLWSGFYAQVVVIDIDTMEIIKTFEKIIPPVAEQRGLGIFFAYTIANVDGVILAVGLAAPPDDYESVTIYANGSAMVVAIHPETLEILGFHTDLSPGVDVKDIVSVNGQAWLLNNWSRIDEKLPREDVYILDPHTLQITGQLNLPQPYPIWGATGADGSVFIFHIVPSAEYQAGMRPGVSRLDPKTLEATFTGIPADVTDRTFSLDQEMDVYNGRPCVTNRAHGLWCINDDGTTTLEIEQMWARGILFAPGGGK